MLGGVDPQRLLEYPERRVAGHVEREQAGRPDLPVMPEPHQRGRQGQVEDQLVQERRLERRVAGVPGRAELRVDGQPPGQAGRLAEQFLVEVVPDPADRLGDQQGRRHRVGEHRDVGAGPVHPPDAYRGTRRDAAPDAQAARPDREDPPPVMRDVGGRGDVEVDPAADDPGRHRPGRHVGDQGGVPARGAPPAPGDHNRQGDPDHVHQPVEVHERRADMESAHRRARDVQGHGPRVNQGAARPYRAPARPRRPGRRYRRAATARGPRRRMPATAGRAPRRPGRWQ